MGRFSFGFLDGLYLLMVCGVMLVELNFEFLEFGLMGLVSVSHNLGIKVCVSIYIYIFELVLLVDWLWAVLFDAMIN